VETRNCVRHLVPKGQFDHRIRDNRRMNTDEIMSEAVISHAFEEKEMESIHHA